MNENLNFGGILILISIIFSIIIFVIFAINLSPTETMLPNGCNLTTNYSESYTTSSLIFTGKVMIPIASTYYSEDLVCDNGTTVLKWR